MLDHRRPAPFILQNAVQHALGDRVIRRKRAETADDVDDMQAARATLESRGVTFKGDTLDTGVCHMALFDDPDGNPLMLHHRYAPRPS